MEAARQCAKDRNELSAIVFILGSSVYFGQLSPHSGGLSSG